MPTPQEPLTAPTATAGRQAGGGMRGFWLGMGSLLGAHRNNGTIIAWDTDADLYVSEDDEQRCATPNICLFFAQLIKNGWTPEHFFGWTKNFFPSRLE